ncbi:MAG TPA: hypothetical protein VMD97_12670 [Candidatus Aquilonibacter sp.]|nr:hypothetical protein [Candidatus Aquilonibacter sp.]
MRMKETIGAWLRGLVWVAMIFGCAWASAQNYMVQPAGGHYHAVAMGAGEGVGLGSGIGVAGAQNSEALPKDDLFAGTEVFAKNATDVTEITMNPDSLNLVGGPDASKAHRTILNVVRTYSYDKPGMYNMADVDAIRNKLNTGDWSCSVHIRDLKNGSGTDVCNKHRTDGLRESAIIEVSPKSLTFIHTIKRPGGPGDSELGFFPMLPGMSGLPALAMMDPDAVADMEIGLHGRPFIMNFWPDSGMKMEMKPFDQQQIKELNDQLKNMKVKPFDTEKMQKLQEQMQELNKDLYKGKEATPQVAPAPQVAPTPEVAPVPPTAPTPQ